MLAFHCELSLALTYSLRNHKLAVECARKCLKAAIGERRPDLAYRANDLLVALGAR